MESSENKDQAEITKERNREKNKWHPKCPKCRRKVYRKCGKHVNTLRMASGKEDGSHEPNREQWYEFRCEKCEFSFALHKESLEENDLLPQIV